MHECIATCRHELPRLCGGQKFLFSLVLPQKLVIVWYQSDRATSSTSRTSIAEESTPVSEDLMPALPPWPIVVAKSMTRKCLICLELLIGNEVRSVFMAREEALEMSPPKPNPDLLMETSR